MEENLSNKFDEAIELILLYSNQKQGDPTDYDSRAMDVLRGLVEAKLEYESLYDFYNAKTPVQ